MANLEPSPEFRELRQLLETPDLADLGPQRRPGARPLGQLQEHVGAVLAKTALLERTKNLIRGTLLLWHDHLDAAHAIAQEIEDADGSLLHAIMHRREPDYGNSKYWFWRVGKHRCYPVIAGKVTALLGQAHHKLASGIIPGGVWDTFAFVDACERAAQVTSGNAAKTPLQEIQRIEFDSFLAYLCS